MPVMPFDDRFLRHLESEGYHPRSAKHSDFLSEIIIGDLISNCPLMKKRAAAGELVVKLRHHQQVGHDDWVIDIAFGTCAGVALPPHGSEIIEFAPPAIVQMAIELKSIFTEHGKARRNRLRDFIAFHGYAHQYSPQTVAGAFLVVNSAEYFYSPLRKVDDITKHGTERLTSRQVAKSAIDLFRCINLRNTPIDPPGLEAMGVIAVEHDNLLLHPESSRYTSLHRSSRIAPIPPSLPVGDPMHYDSMIQRLCAQYTYRFS
jgi:hypothetical protein